MDFGRQDLVGDQHDFGAERARDQYDLGAAMMKLEGVTCTQAGRNAIRSGVIAL